jgi:hypothetical protein
MAIAPNRPANPDARGNAAPCKRRRTCVGCRDMRMNTVPEGKTDAPVYMGS